MGGNENAPEGQLHQPVGVTCDSHGLIYVSQMKPASIKVMSRVEVAEVYQLELNGHVIQRQPDFICELF